MQNRTSYNNITKSAIPFITKNLSTSNYEITKQAQDMLRKIDRPLTVVSVAGLYRTGKSYLLNRVILDKQKVFGVGPTVNPCTKGLWMWIQSDPTRADRDMLVIDTQGLGALDQESNHDMKIFCLAVLLSTTFIYNSVGSIDQNALQTLSLVLNLVSNIDQDSSSDRPTFIWVVRDFSLQLVNGEGQTLTPKEYLEMALNSNLKQKQKVGIRKTITDAFCQRQCFTLVKPLIDQMKLQNLDDIPMDELRSQFISQSIELRNKIKHGLKSFKLATDGEIHGKQYIIVVKKYIQAFNKGAVPNIVDTWAFIKEQKCREALQETKKCFTEKINSKIMTKVPIKKIHADQLWYKMKDQIRKHFSKLAFYDHQMNNCYEENRKYYEGLDDFLKNAQAHINRVNQQEGIKYIRMMLTKDYEPFCKKLFSQYYGGFQQFSKDLKQNFKISIIQKHTDRIDNINEHVDRFIEGKLIENFQFFQKTLKDQISKLKYIKQQLQSTMSQQITQINQGRDQQRRRLQQKIFELEKHVNLLENQKYQIDETSKSEKQIAQGKLFMLKKKAQQSASTIERLTLQLNQTVTQQNQLKQKLFLENKDFQKQRALFKQKQAYLEKRIHQIESRNNDLESRINQTGGRFQIEKKTILKDYQDKINNLQMENRSLLQRNMEAQSKISKLTNQLNTLTDDISLIKKNNQHQKKNWEQRIHKAESNKKATPLQRQLKQQNDELTRQLQRAQQKLAQYNNKVKSTHQQYKQLQNNSQKQIAIHCQKIQFQQIQLKDYETRYNQLKASYQKAMQSLQDTSKSLEHNSQIKLLELKNKHEKDIQALQKQFQDREKILKKELQISQRIVQELQLQVSLDRKGTQTKEKQWKQSNNILQTMCKKLQQKIKSSQKDYEDIFKQKQGFYQHRIRQLEEENDETKEKASQQVDEIKKKSEQTLSVLKHYSQIEKQQWQKRLHDDKQKSDRKLANLKQDYEKRMQQDKASFQEQINDLQEKLAHMDRVFNQRLQNMQYDHDIHVQKITNSFTEIKVQKQKRIALLEQELQIKNATFDREMAAKQRQYEQNIHKTKQSLIQEHEHRQSQLKQAHKHIQEKYEALKKQNRQLQQNNLIIKNQSDKQRALNKQKQKNFQRKIIQLQNKLEDELTTYNSVIEKINEKNSLERASLNDQIQKQNCQILELQKSLNQHEKDYQNMESKLQMKIKYLNQHKQSLKKEYQDFMRKFQTTVKTLNRQNKQLKNKNQQNLNLAAQTYKNQLTTQQQKFKKCQKNYEDRIARLSTENKSLKDRIMVHQIQKPNTNSRLNSAFLQDKNKQLEQRVQQYKEMLHQQRDITKKLREQVNRLRMQVDSSNMDKSQTSVYYQRPSFSEISNSRISQPYQNRGPNQYTQMKNNIYFNKDRQENRENRMDRSKNRKFSNTPLINKKSRVADVQEFSGVSEYSRKSKY